MVRIIISTRRTLFIHKHHVVVRIIARARKNINRARHYSEDSHSSIDWLVRLLLVVEFVTAISRRRGTSN